DMSYAGDGANNKNPWTVWTLRAPDVSSWCPPHTALVCQAQFPGICPERGNDQPNGTVDANRLKALLQDATVYPGTNPPRTVASFFRQWVQLCSVATTLQRTH